MSLVQTAVAGAFPEYPKIDTLFERDHKFVVDPNKLRKPVFGTIKTWDVTEKIDGTNIRVAILEDGSVKIGGRTDNAQLPADLLQLLLGTFSSDKMRSALWIDGNPTQAVLYGEGYGAGIQKGGAYRADKSFILFDVLVGSRWWLDQSQINDVAVKLSVDTVPYLGRWTLDQIVEHVRDPFPSMIGSAEAEGVVARPIETLFDKRGERVIIKLKTRDFIGGKR